jgi:hypothetical protein
MAQNKRLEFDFALYPPQARALVISNAALLSRLPVVFQAILLRQILAYDWNFPAERRQVEDHLILLAGLPEPELKSHLKAFAEIKLNPAMERLDGSADPVGFMEQLTAWLWSSGQMEGFRAAAEEFAAFAAAGKSMNSPSRARLAIVVIGQGAQSADTALFRKLRPYGVYFDNINPTGGLEILLDTVSKRSDGQGKETGERTSFGYNHWYIDGGIAQPASIEVQISYSQLQQQRALLLARVQKVIASGSAGPEALRSLLAKMTPQDIGFGDDTDPVLNHFAMSLLTQGSGTQIFATTFVQWAARECLRRAQPETLLVRYAPRQQLGPMNVMLSEAHPFPPDPKGSLMDADMGAYYTWLNMRRLAGADQMRFLAWFEGHREAVAIGPGLPLGTTSSSTLDMRQMTALLT